MEDVFSRHASSIYRFLYRRVGNKEDADDLTSEVFMKAARQLDTDQPDAAIISWLFTVARTVLADHWRRWYRRAPSVALDDRLLHTAADIEPTPRVNPDAEGLVDAVLATLPDRYRQVLELRFLKGCSIQEAAAQLGVTPGNLKVMQHRALLLAARTHMARYPS
jgi:RNA polymerase sigma-70 factor (ECF subfamily)